MRDSFPPRKARNLNSSQFSSNGRFNQITQRRREESSYYKVVVADSRSPRDGKFIEIIGTYDPKVQGENSTLKLDRADHWIARGAQPSDTVRSLLKKKLDARAAAAPAETAPTQKQRYE